MSKDKAMKNIDKLIFEIEDYVGGNIQGVESIDAMSFTRFLRGVLQQAILSERKRIEEEVEKLREQDCKIIRVQDVERKVPIQKAVQFNDCLDQVVSILHIETEGGKTD